LSFRTIAVRHEFWVRSSARITPRPLDADGEFARFISSAGMNVAQMALVPFAPLAGMLSSG
jgi:hypothetical protein